MKNTLTLLLLIASLTVKAQITLEHSFTPTGGASAILFSSNGEKIMANDTGTNQVKLYNTDYSLSKTINVPVPAGYKFQYATIVSDNLFNTDNSIEFIALCYKYDGSTYPYAFYKSILVNEAGSNVFDFGNTPYISVAYLNGTHKLIAGGYGDYTSKIYSLPGTLPCGHCGTMGVPKTAPASGAAVSAPAPNPGTGMVTITYTLPDGIQAAKLTVYSSEGKEVSTYPVNGYSNQISIDNSKLAPGIYYYILSAENMQPASGKMVVVK